MDSSLYNKSFEWLLNNFNLSMIILAIIFILFHPMINRNLSLREIIYRWFAFFALGCTLLYVFVMHAFFPDLAARMMGLQTSSYQFVVAIANLAFGLLGILSFKASFGFRLATVIGSVIWLWGNALAYIYQKTNFQDFSFNSSSWFLFYLILPIILIILIAKLKPHR